MSSHAKLGIVKVRQTRSSLYRRQNRVSLASFLMPAHWSGWLFLWVCTVASLWSANLDGGTILICMDVSTQWSHSDLQSLLCSLFFTKSSCPTAKEHNGPCGIKCYVKHNYKFVKGNKGSPAPRFALPRLLGFTGNLGEHRTFVFIKGISPHKRTSFWVRPCLDCSRFQHYANSAV